MAKDPAILFYTSDFLSGTAFFTDEQRGQYIRLLCEQHQNGHIPDEHMLNICKSYDSPVFRKFVKDDKGYYYQVRMEQEIQKRVNYSLSRRNNRKGISDDEHMLPHMDNGNRNDINNRELEFKKEVTAFENYSVEMLTAFFNYWSEPNKSKTKMRFELQKTFDIKRRLGTWACRDNDVTAKPSVYAPKFKSYDEMCQLALTNNDIWKQMTAIKFPDMPKTVWAHPNDVVKHNLKQYEVK
jgi:uncharacterized protein YdaU (DUF1376 family)